LLSPVDLASLAISAIGTGKEAVERDAAKDCLIRMTRARFLNQFITSSME
jgi:hypothetical protein